MALLHDLGSVLIIWSAIVGTASVLVHLRVVDRHNTMSMHLLFYMTAMAVVLDLSTIRIIVGDSWWFQLVRLIVFCAIPVVMTQRLYLQIRAQRRPGRGFFRP